MERMENFKNNEKVVEMNAPFIFKVGRNKKPATPII